jgi:hypothetical protein
MSHMLTNIERVVQDVSNRVTQWDALYEGIVNSVHANATKIICRLDSENVLTDGIGDIVPRKVKAIEIEDNGDGFSDTNFNSFGEYKTKHKIDLGCKGVGRFVFLKLFQNVTYISYLSGQNQKREFDFSFNFDSDNLQKKNEVVISNRTILKLTVPAEENFTKNKHINRQIDLDLEHIKNKVFNHLIPTLFFYRNKGKEIKIEFHDLLKGDHVSFGTQDIPDFKSKKFYICDEEFELSYNIKDTVSAHLNAFHCANKRTVCSFSEQEFKPEGFSGFLLLESGFFNNHINNARNDFDIFPIKTDMYTLISWEMINAELKKRIAEILTEEIPNSQKRNANLLEQIILERPYLSDYIEEEDLNIAGFLSKKDIIEKAKKRFDIAKEKLLKSSGKENYSDEELNDAIQITHNELVEYIKYRILVVERLKTMIGDKEKEEKVIHNLFMTRYTEDKKTDYLNDTKNNLWLFDDRFTNYSYAASDQKIKHLLSNVKLKAGSQIDNDRPDFALFFSHHPNDKKGLKAVIIELKSFKDIGKSDREKLEGVQQLLDYINVFRSKEDVKEIWAYLITDIDDKFESRLKINGYKAMFSTSKPIYYKSFEEVNAFINVIGAETLVLDAEARNKVFIDIINKQSRLNKHLRINEEKAV